MTVKKDSIGFTPKPNMENVEVMFCTLLCDVTRAIHTFDTCFGNNMNGTAQQQDAMFSCE
jgi:hypothetical protein